mmetsp:Transcript_27622/g.64839  ORF Transcript_27622/g.64839 Transcript_27622/m.64839 type:complete len:652 (+) Transcript_27622:326-2281(+)
MQSIDGCDESMCVSQGAWNHVSGDTSKPFMNSFTCYGDDGMLYPRMCANGFLPVVVEDEPALSSADWYGNLDANITVAYFTCCPPTTQASKANATRQCSDPILGLARNAGDDAPCSARDTKIVPRQMTTNMMTDWIERDYSVTEIESYVCCDSNAENVNASNNIGGFEGSERANFLNDTECVPYRSERFDGFLRENQLGHIVPISCDFPDETFSVPRPSPTGRYQCCKNGTAMPPFVHDRVFNMTVYPVITLWSISSIVSTIGVIGLLIPFVRELKKTNKNTYARQSQRAGEPRFSSYNLYLLYLMFFDLVFALINVGWCSSYINQNYYRNLDGFLGGKRSLLRVEYKELRDVTFGWVYTLGNFYINCLILNQVLGFLKTFRSGQRITPPSFTRINLQIGVIYILILVFGLVFYVLLAGPRMDYKIAAVMWQVVGWPAFIYNLWVPIRIWWLGYLPSLKSRGRDTIAVSGSSSINWRSSNTSAMDSVRDRAMRELALYYLRIIFVFSAIWTPALIMTYLLRLNDFTAWFAANCLHAIQPIATFCFVMTKSDVRDYILDFVSCSTFGSKETLMLWSSVVASRGTKANHVCRDTSVAVSSVAVSTSGIGDNRMKEESIASADSDGDPERGRDGTRSTRIAQHPRVSSSISAVN